MRLWRHSKRSLRSRESTAGLVALLVVFGCVDKGLVARGELVLAISTNMSPSRDFDKVEVEVQQHGASHPLYEIPSRSTGSLKMPTTVVLSAGTGSPEVRIEVRALKNHAVVTSRLVHTTIPSERMAVLPVVLQALCVRTTCVAPETCIVGACQSSEVASATLDTYQTPEQRETSADTPEGGCFDTAGCFRDSTEATLDRTRCVVPTDTLVGGTERANFALRLPGMEPGIDLASHTLVPLDREGHGAAGWRALETEVALPPGVCTALENRPNAVLVVTHACPPKVAALSPCASQSPVDGGRGDADGLEAAEVSFEDAAAEADTAASLDSIVVDSDLTVVDADALLVDSDSDQAVVDVDSDQVVVDSDSDQVVVDSDSDQVVVDVSSDHTIVDSDETSTSDVE